MHIPDGYLSPSTAAALYGAAGPFWYVALRRVKKELNARTIPLLSVFSAFSFVIMMFNLPLPGGTTGHAVGMGMAAIVLGPWVSILAISIALFIQALFFGDGGITAFGANCFNMAIIGSLVAFAMYRALAYGAAITAPRRVFAAAVAGYAAINASALCAAVEFGIQPLLFKDASGAPLYAPYPLSVSIPAMMIGHLTFAGLAELVLSAGVIRYLQRTDPALLMRSAPEAPATEIGTSAGLRSLWLALTVLLLLTPLGILAVGSAWGEWKLSDFMDTAGRAQIAAASSSQAPPTHVPQGLQHLSGIWKAPLADYAPSFLHNPSAAYLVSAATGVCLIIGLVVVIVRLYQRFAPTRKRRKSFAEKTVNGILTAMQDSFFAEDLANHSGFLQSLDARSKLVGICALILSAIAVHKLSLLVVLFAVGLVLAVSSRVSLPVCFKRVWLPVLGFTGVLATPALFLVPGIPIARVPLLGWPVTYQGLYSALLLTMRAEVASTFALLLVMTTRWNYLLRSLRFFRLPVVLVVIAESTYRFIFLLLQNTRNMLESRQTRLVGRLSASEQRHLAVASASVLLDKTMQLSSEVYTAMQARGFRGDAKLLDDFHMRLWDGLQLAGFVTIACLAVWMGR